MARSRKKIGEILVGWGVVTQDQIDKGMQKAKADGKRLGEALVEMGACKEDQVAKALANQFGMEFVDLGAPGIADKLDLKLIPDDLIKKHLILPMSKSGNRLTLVIHDPLDLDTLDQLRFRLSVDIDPRLAAKSAIKKYVEGASQGTQRTFTAGQSLVTDSIDKSVDRSVDRSVDKSMDKSIDQAAEDAPVVKLVNRILSEAVRMRASDVHVEPMADRVRLRYRIDGVCMERDNLPKRMQNAVLSRFKLMAGVNIAEKRVPQDGRIKLNVDDVFIDFRVSACPAYHGESIVCRILRPDSVRIGLVNLGFEADSLDAFNKIIRRPNGIFLVTGPTGSGKTTTLYSALDILNRPDKKIITAEDPIEYAFGGINQCQVRDNIGLTFSSILRSMLRQAPNIILVGEIRDKEVAEIAIQAALTGHLVFSTLHTNDAPSSIIRMVDLGLEPFLLTATVEGIIAQRLVRRVCTGCKEEYTPKDEELMELNLTPDEVRGKRFVRGLGCEKCHKSGYKGRAAIFEIMTMDDEMRELIMKNASTATLRNHARRRGMRTLRECGLLSIYEGITTIDEVVRETVMDE